MFENVLGFSSKVKKEQDLLGENSKQTFSSSVNEKNCKPSCLLKGITAMNAILFYTT